MRNSLTDKLHGFYTASFTASHGEDNTSVSKMNKFFIVVLSVLPSLAAGEVLQRIDGMPVHPMTLEAFVKLTKAKNTGIENQRLVVESAIANKAPMSAPNLNPLFTYNKGSYFGQTPYEPYVSPTSDTYMLTLTVEGWGKRSARSKVADSEAKKSQSELRSATNNVELEASFAYLDALRPKLNAIAYQKAVSELKQIRIPDADPLNQQYVNKEQQEIRNYKYFMLGMLNLIPKTDAFLVEPVGRGVCKANNKALDDLLKNALDHRTDLVAMDESIKVADDYVDLAKANRMIDITPSVWTSRTPSYNDSGYSYNPTTSYGFSIQVPIPTHLIFDASVTQAVNNKAQVQNNRDQLHKQVQVELRQSIMQYESSLSTYKYAVENNRNADKAYPPNSKRNIQTRTDYEIAMIDARINHSKALVFLMNKSGHYDVTAYCENH